MAAVPSFIAAGLPHRRTTGILLAAISLFGGCGEPPVAVGVLPKGASPPNIIFIMIDTLRADRLGCYGHAGGLSPAIDSIAARGVVFERAIAQAPWTQPSIASLFSACNPGVHQVTSYVAAVKGSLDDAAKVRVFDEKFETLAEHLTEAGYTTAAFVANPFILAEYGFAQGFGKFDASFGGNTVPGDKVNEAATRWLESADDSKPYFLYLHYMDVHGPYEAAFDLLDPLLRKVERRRDRQEMTSREIERLRYLNKPPLRYDDLERYVRLMRYREYWIARYEAGVRQIDRHIATLRDHLIEKGLWQNAYVIITSDHGEALCEHGFWDHGFSVHDYEVRVPLILRWPNVLPAKKRIEETVRLIDVMPTLLDQLRRPALANVQGVSLVPLFADNPSFDPLVALSQAVKMGPPQRAVYYGDWKLLEVLNPPPTGVSRALYYVADDPLEQTNLAGSQPNVAATLASEIQHQLADNKSLRTGGPGKVVSMPPERLRALRAIGYLGASDSATTKLTRTTSDVSDDP